MLVVDVEKSVYETFRPLKKHIKLGGLHMLESRSVSRQSSPPASKKEAKTSAVTLLKKAIARKTVVTEKLFVANVFSAEPFLDKLCKAGFKPDGAKHIFEGKQVFVFAEKELVTFLKKSHLHLAKKTACGTKNVEWIWFDATPDLSEKVLKISGPKLCEPVRSENVDVNDIDKASRKSYQYVIASLLYPLLGRPIKFSVPHNKIRDFDHKGPFQIYIWSTPTDRFRNVTPPRQVWGIPVSCRDEAYVPDNRRDKKQFGSKKYAGIPIRDGKYIVAELFSNALYVHHDLVHHSDNNEIVLFVELLRRCQPLLASAKEFEKYRQEVEEERLAVEKEEFLLFVEKNVAEKRAHRQKKALALAEKDAEEKRLAFFEAERTLFAEREAQVDPNVVKVRFQEEFEKLQSGRVPLIEGAAFVVKGGSPCVVLHTAEIVVKHPREGTMHLIGRCEVTFDLESGKIRIVNLTHTFESGGNTFHTPHVFDDGRTCLGNIYTELTEYLAHCELEAAAVLTTAFLQSVTNTPGYLEHLKLFPTINKGKARGSK